MNIYYRLLTKFLNFKTSIIRISQDNPLSGIDKLPFTVFFDFEGKYSLSERQIPCFKALDKILVILDDSDIKATFNTVGMLAKENSSIIKMLDELGHEVASHSYDHNQLIGQNRHQLLNHFYNIKEVFNNLEVSIRGHRSPMSRWNFKVLHALLKNGYEWNAENDLAPYPYCILTSNNNSLWRFPIKADDYNYILHNYTPLNMLEYWMKTVTINFENRNGFAAVGFHPWIQNEHDRLIIFKEFIDWICSNNNVTISPFGDWLDYINTNHFK